MYRALLVLVFVSAYFSVQVFLRIFLRPKLRGYITSVWVVEGDAP
jgi:hypothetical protein